MTPRARTGTSTIRRPGGLAALVPSRSTVSAHAPFAVVLGLAALLRLAATAAYSPAFEFLQDSFSYLADARHLNPDVVRPVAYSVFLRGLSTITPDLRIVPVSQHLLALAAGTSVYLLLRRLGTGRWWGALAVTPFLLDGYQVAVEQFVLSETLFEFLAAVAFTALLWHRRPGWRAAALAGALLSAATLTRTVGIVLLVPAGVVLLLQVRLPRHRQAEGGARGWVPLAAFCAACSLLLGGYAGWFRSVHGTAGLVAYNGYFLAGRMMTFGDCSRLQLPAEEQALCDTHPVALRETPGLYTWDPGSPLRHPGTPPGPARNREATHIAYQIVAHQPGDYLRIVFHDLLHYVQPVRRTGRMDGPIGTLQFPTAYVQSPWVPAVEPPDPYLVDWNYPGPVVQDGRLPASYGFALEQLHPTINRPLAQALRSYQRVVYTPGPLLALAAGLALVSALRRRSRQRDRLRLPAATLGAAGALSLLLPALTAGFDYRYGLPTLVLLPPAGVLAAVTILRSRQSDPNGEVPAPAGEATRVLRVAGGSQAPPGAAADTSADRTPTAGPAVTPRLAATRGGPPTNRATLPASPGVRTATVRNGAVVRLPTLGGLAGRAGWLPLVDGLLVVTGLALLLAIPQIAEHPNWLPGELFWHDGWERYRIVEAFVHGTPVGHLKDVDPGWTGRWPLLPTLLTAPLWYLGDLVLSPAWWVASSNVLVFAAGLGTLWWCLRRQVQRDVLRTFLLLLVAASMFPGHLVSFFPFEVVPAVFVGVGLLLVHHGRGRLGWTLAAVGAAVVPATLAALAVVAVVQSYRDRRLRYLLAPVATALLIVADNYVRLGTLRNGYAVHDRGAPTLLPFSSSVGFTHPVWLGLLGLVLSFGKGLLFFAPGLFLPARAALRAVSACLWRGHVTVALGGLTLLLLYSAWQGWDGGFFWGPRFLLIASVPACLALAAVLHRPPDSLPLRVGLLGVLALSVWVGVNGAAYGMGGLSTCDPAVGTGQSYLCIETAEFSPLFHPFIHAPSLRTPQLLFVLFGVVVFARLGAPLIVGVVHDLRARASRWSLAQLTTGWRV